MVELDLNKRLKFFEDDKLRALAHWVLEGPLWITATKNIAKGEELLAKYYSENKDQFTVGSQKSSNKHYFE